MAARGMLQNPAMFAGYDETPIQCVQDWVRIAADMVCVCFFFFSQNMLMLFLFLHKNICCGYSLEAPRQGTSNKYPQHTFSWRNKKNIYMATPLTCSYDKMPLH